MQFHYVCREGGMTAMNRFTWNYLYIRNLKFEIHYSSLTTIMVHASVHFGRAAVTWGQIIPDTAHPVSV